MSTLLKFVFGSQVLQFSEGASYPASRPIRKLVIKDRTAAGTLRIEELGITIRERPLVFEDMIKSDHDLLRDWFDNVVNGCMEIFEFTDERGFVGNVQIIDETFDFVEDDFELFSGVLNLEYV